MLSREWRCCLSSADSALNYIWVINNVIAYDGTTYIRSLTVYNKWVFAIVKKWHIEVCGLTSLAFAKLYALPCYKCLFNHLFRRRSKKISKLRVTDLCEWNLPVTGGSRHKGPVTRKMFPFYDAIMQIVIQSFHIIHYIFNASDTKPATMMKIQFNFQHVYCFVLLCTYRGSLKIYKLRLKWSNI